MFTLRKTLARVKGLENYFGLFYAQDSYGDLEHKLEHKGYSVLHNLVEDVEKLQKKVTELEGKKK